jgi:hypothetical protein
MSLVGNSIVWHSPCNVHHDCTYHDGITKSYVLGSMTANSPTGAEQCRREVVTRPQQSWNRQALSFAIEQCRPSGSLGNSASAIRAKSLVAFGSSDPLTKGQGLRIRSDCEDFSPDMLSILTLVVCGSARVNCKSVLSRDKLLFVKQSVNDFGSLPYAQSR